MTAQQPAARKYIVKLRINERAWFNALAQRDKAFARRALRAPTLRTG